MKRNRLFLALLSWHASPLGNVATAQESATPLYLDASQPIARRIDDLLGRMTLEEKIGQMNMPCVYESELGRSIAEKTERVQKFAAGNLAGRTSARGAASSPCPTRFSTRAPASRPSS